MRYTHFYILFLWLPQLHVFLWSTTVLFKLNDCYAAQCMSYTDAGVYMAWGQCMSYTYAGVYMAWGQGSMYVLHRCWCLGPGVNACPTQMLVYMACRARVLVTLHVKDHKCNVHVCIAVCRAIL